MEPTPYTLVITDNKAMASAIARTFDYTEDHAGSFCYDGDNKEVLWTGGMLIDLVIKRKATPSPSIKTMSAEEISREYYNAVVRSEKGQMLTIDRMRLEYIEKALSYCDEVVFICQPTDEGEKLVQAIKLFFNIKLPMHTVRLDKCTMEEVEYVVENHNYTDVVNQYRSDVAMRNNVRSDYYRKKMVTVDTEQISPQAFAMLKFIDNTIKCDEALKLYTAGIGKTLKIGGVTDIDTLFFAMSAKYDMIMESMWDSLLWLYAEGLISNPMTRQTHSLSKEIMFGDASNDKTMEFWSDNHFLKHVGAIRPELPINESLLNLPYDCEEAPDDLLPRTSAVYTYIVEQSKKVNGCFQTEKVECPTNIGEEYLPVSKLAGFSAGTSTLSVENSLGYLLSELRGAGCVELHNGFITITEEGYEAIENNA